MKKGAKYMRPDFRGIQYADVETKLHHCLTDFCRRTVNKETEHSPYCCVCRRARWKNSNPLKYSFGNLRRRAKQRGKDFSLTFEQYESFAIKTDYARLKGKSSLSLSIDRKDNSEGYHHWNIKVLTLSENTRKQFVKFYAQQQENQAYQPTAEEIEEIQRQLAES